jgi:hypothetical protein
MSEGGLRLGEFVSDVADHSVATVKRALVPLIHEAFPSFAIFPPLDPAYGNFNGC